MSLTNLLPFRWLFSPDSSPRELLPSLVRPKFEELPLKPGNPKGSAWGLWGHNDERGTLNLVTGDVVRAAAAECILGRVVNLK